MEPGKRLNHSLMSKLRGSVAFSGRISHHVQETGLWK